MSSRPKERLRSVSKGWSDDQYCDRNALHRRRTGDTLSAGKDLARVQRLGLGPIFWGVNTSVFRIDPAQFGTGPVDQKRPWPTCHPLPMQRVAEWLRKGRIERKPNPYCTS